MIGLPGDKIQVIGGVLHINGKAVQRERVEDFRPRISSGRDGHVPRYKETLPERGDRIT